MKTRRLLLVSALLVSALVVAGAAVWLLARPSVTVPVAVTPQVTSAPVAEVPSTPSPARERCSFTVGERYDVALEVSSSVELVDAPAPVPSGSRLTETLKAVVGFEVLETSAEGAVLAGQLREVRAVGSLPASAYLGAFLVEVEPSCELSRFARHQSTSAADARVVQAAVWELSWRLSRGEEHVTRHNGRGNFVATVVTTPSASGSSSQRRITAYSTLWLGGQATSVNHFTRVQSGPTGWFDTLSSEESLFTSAGPQHTSVHASVTPGKGALQVDRRQASYVWEDLLPKVLNRRQAMRVTQTDLELREAMRGKSAGEAVAFAQQSFETEQNLAKAWPPLRAYLEARPEQTQAVVTELRHAKVTEAGLNPFFIALGNARTTESRDELLGLVRDRRAPPTVRARAMFALVDRADVGVELAQEFAHNSQALESNPSGDARFVSSEALLALSTMAGLHEDPDIQEVAVEAVRGLLRPDADRKTQGTALRALANLGDPALLADAEPYTHSSEERVRRAATKVIRRMRPADTDRFVRQWLEREPSLFVKKDLFVTLVSQHHDASAQPSEALTRLLTPELADERHGVIARKALLRLVGNSVVAAAPEIRVALKAQAKRALRKRDGLLTDALQVLTPDEIREVAP